jgi:drug/metabolite transporter (DMT)-like permease
MTRQDLFSASALAVAVASISTSGPLIAYAAAPALAIAFWRNAIAAGALAPVAATRRRRELRLLLTSREGLVSVIAGAALAVHFGAWVPSVRLTTVATATALVATQPVWQGLIARAQGRRLPAPAWVGIALAVGGAVAVTGADLRVSATAVAGDLLALVGGLAGAVYTAAGERVRVTTSTTSYTTVCYGVCTGFLLAVCLLGGVPLAGYPGTAWLAIAALVIGPQLLGHSMYSYALRRVPATTVSVLYLLEVPAAAVIGWLWLGQLPPAVAWPGLALLVIGVAVVILTRRRTRTAPASRSRSPRRSPPARPARPRPGRR